MKLDVIPHVSVDSVRFGMTRNEVRALWGKASEFKKTPEAETTTDDFGFCHVYYDENDCCEAIEIFDDADVWIDGGKVFPLAADEMLEAFPQFEEDEDGPICADKAMAVYAPDGKAESILLARRGYFDFG